MRTIILIFGLFLQLDSFAQLSPVAVDRYVLRDIVFVENSDKLNEEQVATLRLVVDSINEFLGENDSVQYVLVINGNSNQLERSPKRLSKRRARVVKDCLVEFGLTHIKLLTVAQGTRRPLADPNSDTGKKRNSRVDFQISPE